MLPRCLPPVASTASSLLAWRTVGLTCMLPSQPFNPTDMHLHKSPLIAVLAMLLLAGSTVAAVLGLALHHPTWIAVGGCLVFASSPFLSALYQSVFAWFFSAFTLFWMLDLPEGALALLGCAILTISAGIIATLWDRFGPAKPMVATAP